MSAENKSSQFARGVQMGQDRTRRDFLRTALMSVVALPALSAVLGGDKSFAIGEQVPSIASIRIDVTRAGEVQGDGYKVLVSSTKNEYTFRDGTNVKDEIMSYVVSGLPVGGLLIPPSFILRAREQTGSFEARILAVADDQEFLLMPKTIIMATDTDALGKKALSLVKDESVSRGLHRLERIISLIIAAIQG